MLVHLDRDLIPTTYRLLRVTVPETMAIGSPGPLPPDWRDQHGFTRSIGDQWLDSRASAVLQVPSVIVPEGQNYCLNPDHPYARNIVITETIDAAFDRRLLGQD